MGTLEELLASFGLSEEQQTKVASSAEQEQTSTDEVDQVLESLGLTGAEDSVTKVANANVTQQGEKHMSLTSIYEEMFGEAPAQQSDEGQEKIASQETNEVTELFGELTSHYCEAGIASILEKVAGSVEEEADQDEEAPMHHLGTQSSLGSTMGKQKDAQMPVNHSASSGAPLKAAAGNTSPYSLKELAFLKAVVSRIGKNEAGYAGAIHE